MQFEGLDDRTAAERLTGRTLLRRAARPTPTALWVHELIGATVVDADGIDRGTCVVGDRQPGARHPRARLGHLVPVTFVDRVEDGVITIDPPDGLFDLLD